jgi:YVTN family beta-propeller protein
MIVFQCGGRSLGRVATRLGYGALLLLLVFVWANCGQTYRPIAQPILGPSPSPQPVGHVYAIASNGSVPSNTLLNRGSMDRINVSGDSVLSSVASGLAPVHGALSTDGSKLYVANSGEDTVTVSPNATNTQGATINLVPLCDALGCPAVAPVFLGTTERGRMYAADSGNGTVSVIDTSSEVVVQTFAVNPAFAANPPAQPRPLPDRNSHPVALAELPNAAKIYSVNNGNHTIASIDTVDGTIVRVIALGAAPLWAVASADSAHVYALDDSGTISVIDTLSDSVVSSVAAGAGANYLLYDAVFNRIYVTVGNPSPPAVRFYDIAGSTLLPHGTGLAAITAAGGSLCSSAPIPVSVTVLGDGSRAYVASYQADPGEICTQATVINAGTGLVSKTVALTQAANNTAQSNCDKARFRVFATSSSGGTNSNFKVYVAQCDAGTTAVIYTNAISTGTENHPADVFMAWVPSPASTFPASQVSISAISTTSPQTCPSPTAATYAYTLLSGPALAPGMTVYISDMKALANNGTFIITAATSSTFTVENSCPAQDGSGQNGTGAVLPPQNPVFLLSGP